MLARKSQLSPRTPPVHERIALQCAKNISKLAASLPKPRTRSGHLPVLVELRRPEEDVVYRYQVNLPPSCLDRDHQQMNAAEAKALSQQLKLPCLVHGRAQEASSVPQALLPLDTLGGEAPQLMMMQDAVHVVHSRHKHEAIGEPATKEAISTFHYPAYASGASKITRDHFMATLHEEQSSPLQFELLWADQHEELDEGENLQPQLLNAYEPPSIDLHTIAQHFPSNGEEDGTPSPLEPANSYRFVPPPKALPSRHYINRHHTNRPQQVAHQLPSSLKAEQLPLRVLNGYRQQRRANKFPNYWATNNNDKMIYQQKRFGNSYRVAPPQLTSFPPIGPNGYKPQHHEPPFYCDFKDYNAKEQEPRERECLPNANPQPYRMDGVHPLYAHLPRVDNYGHHFDLQRELLLRQKLEQELDHQRLMEQQKYQRIFTESLMTSQVPQELQSLFHWDCCHLCHTAMRTMRNALDHYLSRTHLRRVDSWLIRYSFVKGNLSEDMLRHLRSSGPAVLHCDLCDLKLTSVIHARQHFYGRRHRLVERHISKPNGEGYYDRTGRWVRTNDKWLMCKLCDVIVTSESQLAIHMAGVRHRKRERSTCPASISEPFDGSHVYRINANGSLVPLNPLGYYMYAGYSKPDFRKLNDLNAAYYCEVCNITLNHLKSVKQHEEGRVHRKRLERVTQ
ncbi:uncharacterized protein LOC115758945 isoform X1 [Drosophila novamexicana]|uniref:uncharacterized protein LOC115758945 isoform X1 n=1 Tax=Drosophila novamexicana TaxID=47314 RepID=UPI0011E5C0F9|nr:uncharacterized protein LOC115758945 isoform X1 [Drosophila novamexicana]